MHAHSLSVFGLVPWTVQLAGDRVPRDQERRFHGRFSMLNPITRSHASQLALAISVILASASALAAENPGDESDVREIIVTARKAPERLLDVPISISAFVSDDLEESGAHDLYDLAHMTPGFSFEKLNRYGVQGGVS